MNDWASKFHVRVYMYESIDNPWKSDKNLCNIKFSQGPNEAEGHYGLWRREDTSNGPRYLEK